MGQIIWHITYNYFFNLAGMRWLISYYSQIYLYGEVKQAGARDWGKASFEKIYFKNMPFKSLSERSKIEKCDHLKGQNLNPSLNSGCNHKYKPTLSDQCTRWLLRYFQSGP